MSKPVNKEWVLKGEIKGAPQKDDFEIREIEYREAKDGEIVIKTDFFSVDPYLRGQFKNPDTWNKVVNCYSVGTVVESKNDKYPVGTFVTGVLPAQLYITTADSTLRIMDPSVLGDLPLSYSIGCLGMPGATAHGANKNTKAGDVVLINASAGIVGSMLGKLAKLAGAKLVIGTAGGPTKCALAVEKYGYDVCIDYKEFQGTEEEKAAGFGAKLKEILAQNNVQNINVYYDLVGSWMTDAVIGEELIAYQGKAIIIGAIDEYNADKTLAPRLLFHLVYKAITVQGFIVSSYFGSQFPEYYKEFEGDVVPLIKEKSMNLDETVMDGFDKITEAFIGLFEGRNTGKMVIKA